MLPKQLATEAAQFLCAAEAAATGVAVIVLCCCRSSSPPKRRSFWVLPKQPLTSSVRSVVYIPTFSIGLGPKAYSQGAPREGWR